jgi:hypothetical protein
MSTSDKKIPENGYIAPNNEFWWSSPELVSQWARPFGGVVNLMTSQSNLGSHKARVGVNIAVSRKTTLKNNFFTISQGLSSHSKWNPTTMQQLAVQYSVELVKCCDKDPPMPVVVVTAVVVDDPEIEAQLYEPRYDQPDERDRVIQKSNRWQRNVIRDETDDRLIIESIENKQMKPTQASIDKFVAHPLRGWYGPDAETKQVLRTRVIVPIGRVLHSPMRVPNGFEALTSCFQKRVYDRLPPITVELGCP